MKTKHIIIGLIILIGILFFIQKKEHAGTVPPPASPASPTSTANTQLLSNEAIQNIAKVYADTSGIATFNNINVTSWKGMITMWSGDPTKLPTGWALCDGQIVNGFQTPNLSGKFILGFGKGKDSTNKDLTERKMGDVGGEERVVLTEAEMPKHKHKYDDRIANEPLRRNNDAEHDWAFNRIYDFIDRAKYAPALSGTYKSIGDWDTWYDETNNAWGANGGVNNGRKIWGKKNVDTQETGQNNSHNNMPPFYVLAYIIKL